jgi:hypothetical protein
MTIAAEQIEGLYLAYFGRPADPGGLAFYLSNPSTDIWAVAQAFSVSAESQALYGTTFNASAVNAIYENLFNRTAEAAGVSYWTGEVAAGHLTAAGAAFAILLGAQNNDRTTINNKLAVCTAFTDAIDTPQEESGYSGDAAASMARSFLRTVGFTQTALALGRVYAAEQVAAITGGVTLIENTPLASATTVTLEASRPNLLAAGFDRLFSTHFPVWVKGLESGSTLEFDGLFGTTGSVRAELATNTASDELTIIGAPAYYDGNDAASQWKGSFNLTIDIPGVEHLNFVASGAQLTNLSNPAATWKPDYCIDTLNINSATQMMTINVTGDQIAVVNGSSPSLISVDASKLAPVATEVDVVSQVGFIFQGGGQPGTLVTGSQHCGNELYGSNATLVGGPYADLLAGINSSTLTGGGGNDMFRCQPAFLIGLETVTQVGTITDFSPNTRYHGLTGIPNMGGADSSAGSWDWNGDVIDLRGVWKNGDICLRCGQRITSGAGSRRGPRSLWHGRLARRLDRDALRRRESGRHNRPED